MTCGDGVVGLLDFGGAGTSVTLVSLAGDFQPISPTMRYDDFSGDEVDHALILKVFEELGHGSDIDSASTEGVGQLGHLREQCREAKERLSTETVTELATELAGHKCRMKLTRDQLEDLIHDRLSSVIYALGDMLVRRKKGWADLSAVVAVGGGASIPLVTERLSRHAGTGRDPVATGLGGRAGALLLASRGEQLDMRTRTSIGLLTAAAGRNHRTAARRRDGDRPGGAHRSRIGVVANRIRRRRASASFDDFYEDGPAGWSMRMNVIEPPKEGPWRRVRLSQMFIGMCAVVAMTAIGRRGIHVVGRRNPRGARRPPSHPFRRRRSAPWRQARYPRLPRPAPAPSAQPVPSPAPPPPPPSPSPPPPPPVIVPRRPRRW